MKLISDSSLRLRRCVGGGGRRQCDICDLFESVTGIDGVFCLQESNNADAGIGRVKGCYAWACL